MKTNDQHIKRLAKKFRKELGIPHHAALDKAAAASGFSNWRHFKNTSFSSNKISLPPRVRIRRGEPIPVGTLVRLKHSGHPLGLVYESDGSTVAFYHNWGPLTAADDEVTVCRDQSRASKFKPLRLVLPYGKWTCEDGTEVLFNRDYCPIWKKLPSGEVVGLDPNEFVEHSDKKEEWFYIGVCPIDKPKILKMCLDVLRVWRVENRCPTLLALLPKAIRTGNMKLLKGYRYNDSALYPLA